MDFYQLGKIIELLELEITINMHLLKTGLDSLRTASKNVVHKTGEFLGNKIADAAALQNSKKIIKPDENPKKY